MEVIVLVAVLAFFAFRQLMQLKRRTMIHQERLAAIEKGVALPPFEEEASRRTYNVQRIMLLAGLIWLSLGITAFVTLSALIAHPMQTSERIPPGLQWIGLAPACIGLSHLIVYLVGKRRGE